MANQHFFKPLLPGFHSHLTIPVFFFLKNIEGRNKQKTAELRSDASKITWKVKICGQRLTKGWKEFALAHDLRIGDILVFRQEREMSFHVTVFGPSFCEIQYELCLEDQNNIGKKNKRRNQRTEAEFSLDPSYFVANITPSSLRYDSLNLPVSFVRANGLGTRCGEMILMNEKGRSWTVDLKQKTSCITTYIRRGWRSFCRANGLRAGDSCTFKLIHRGGTPILRLSPKEPEEEDCSSESNEIKSLSTESDSDEDRNQDKRISQESSGKVKRSSCVKGPPPSNKEYGLEPLKRPSRSYQRRDVLNRVYASDEARVSAINRAEKLRSSLDLKFPSFIRPLLQSHVYRGFWLGLPHQFCKAHLPKRDQIMYLVDEKNEKFVANYLAERNCFSGGWRGFAIDHQLVDGDAVVFHLLTPTMFKVYIIRVNGDAKTDSDGNEENKESDIESTEKQYENVSEARQLRSSGKRKRGESDSDEDRNQNMRISQECPKRKEKKGNTSRESRWKASSSPSQNRFVTVTLTRYNFRDLPLHFTNGNDIKMAKKMSLLDKYGVKWSTNLYFKKNDRKKMRLVGGWKEFCDANGVEIGESIMLELIWEADRSFALKFFSKVTPQPK